MDGGLDASGIDVAAHRPVAHIAGGLVFRVDAAEVVSNGQRGGQLGHGRARARRG